MITTQRLDARLGLRDQVLEDRGRNVVAVERGLERRGVPARLCMEPVPLQHGVVDRRVGIDVGLVDLVMLVERRRPIGLVGVGVENRSILTVGQRHFAPTRQDHRRMFDVSRRQCRVGI